MSDHGDAILRKLGWSGPSSRITLASYGLTIDARVQLTEDEYTYLSELWEVVPEIIEDDPRARLRLSPDQARRLKDAE